MPPVKFTAYDKTIARTAMGPRFWRPGRLVSFCPFVTLSAGCFLLSFVSLLVSRRAGCLARFSVALSPFITLLVCLHAACLAGVSAAFVSLRGQLT